MMNMKHKQLTLSLSHIIIIAINYFYRGYIRYTFVLNLFLLNGIIVMPNYKSQALQQKHLFHVIVAAEELDKPSHCFHGLNRYSACKRYRDFY